MKFTFLHLLLLEADLQVLNLMNLGQHLHHLSPKVSSSWPQRS